MNDRDWLAERFEENRTRLRALATRMVGSHSEADDALQEAWLRLSHSDTSDVQNLGGWLTTVVSRVCLDMLRSSGSRREEPLDMCVLDPVVGPEHGSDPEHEAILGDAVGLAMLVVLDTLEPAERVAFVLHDMFSVPYDEIASIVERSPVATRQLASRARRRVQGAAATPDAQPARRRQIVDAFLAASRAGDFEALLAMLDPDVVLRADSAAVQSGASAEVLGAKAVAGTFTGRARAARTARVDGEAGLVWAPGGKPSVVFAFTIAQDKVIAIDLVADPERLRAMELEIL
jgi:RNA polymerase sigma factor (sigma-70 family)